MPVPITPDNILVRVSLATICGSDLHTVSGRRSADTPCVLGHEIVGTIAAPTTPPLRNRRTIKRGRPSYMESHDFLWDMRLLPQ